MAIPTYALYAIRYATRPARRPDHFIGGDAHDAPMPMDYFTWVAIGDDRTVVIDTGFDAAMAHKRKREFLRCPVEALRLLGVDPETVEDVVLTHLHYDHVGNFSRFPRARFHLQEPELAYATGRYMRYPAMSHAYEVEEVCGIVRLNFGGRVVFHNGDADLAPGIGLHLAGGHTAGLQFVTVQTARGRVALASDAAHFYENIDAGRPFPVAFHVGMMHEAYDKLRAQAPPSHIIPGHDPKVMTLYPPPSAELAGQIVRLDVEPAGGA
jgi:glyoxylase-like metal-dependent hydrolase (beta-lactamase superfamily II)